MLCRSVVWRRAPLGLLVWLCPCLAQTGLPTPSVYESFLAQVAGLVEVEDYTPVLLNGEPGAVTQPAPKDVIGLTDGATRVLNELAKDCGAEIRLLKDAASRLTFERRLRVISSQEIPAWLAQGLRDLDERRTQIVMDHVQRLEEAFGAARFRMLNDFIRSREKDQRFFPAPADPTRPVPKRAVPAVKK